MLRTSATRGFVGTASVVPPGLAIVGRVDTFHRVKVRPCGSPSYGSRVHGARPDAQTAGRCDGRSGYLNRRRSRGSATTEDSWWFHPAEQRIVRLRPPRRPAGSPRAAGLHWPPEELLRTSCAEGLVETAGAGDAATGSRERPSTGPIPTSGVGSTGPIRLALIATQWPVSSGRVIASSTDGTDDPVLDQICRHSSEGSAYQLGCERGGC